MSKRGLERRWEPAGDREAPGRGGREPPSRGDREPPSRGSKRSRDNSQPRPKADELLSRLQTRTRRTSS
jgi:hypothetical protein